MPRARSQAISFGTSSAASGTPGLEKMQTVLMSGIQQELFVPFRAQDRAVDDRGFEPHILRRLLHALASGAVQLRIAHDPALADLLSAYFKLRLDEYNHFGVRS